MKNSQYNFGLFVLCIFGFSCKSDKCSEDSYTTNANLYSARYSNDSLMYLYEIKDCYPTGVNLYFYKDGKIREYGYSQSGKRIGEWLYYKNDGSLLSRIYYKPNGELNHVTDAKGTVFFDYKALRLKNNTGDSINLKSNDFVSRSHPSEIKLYKSGNDTFVLETSSVGLLLNIHLTEIGRYEMKNEE